MTLPRGRVFTPPGVAQLLWRAVAEALVSAESEPTSGWTIAEPAAGQGALIRPALSDKRVHRVYGVELCGEDIAAWPNDPRLCAAHADALTLCAEDAPASFEGEQFNAVRPPLLRGAQRTLLGQGWADAVIANPPYLRETGNAAVFRRIRSWHDGHWLGFYRKNADLHHFFWPLAVRWLRPGGVLGFLTPAYFLESDAATPVRELLAREGEVLGVWRAGHDSTFDVGVEASVTLWRKHTAEACRAAHTVAAPRLHVDLSPRGDSFVVPANGGPWWWFDPQVDTAARPEEDRNTIRLGDVFSIVEGVSTGANRTRAVDGPLKGILVLNDAELSSLELPPQSHARFVRRRWRSSPGPEQWVLLIRDQSLECLDGDSITAAGPHAALASHLLRHAPRLRARAEMRRNPRRSWYATAWARGQQNETGNSPTLCTPKWSRAPAFTLVPSTHIPMTDHRLLIPHEAMTNAELRLWSDHLNAQGGLFARRLKRKGRLLEFYGRALADIRIPALPPPDSTT